MARQVVTRTQRRMEKRHALLMLALLLVACLISFALGVMVGRGGSREDVVEERIPQQKPAQVVASVEAEPVPETAPVEAPVKEELTFYDTLPQGQDNAMGSGINLPPEEEKPQQVPDKLASRRPAQKTVSLPVEGKPGLPEAGTVAEAPVPQKPAVQKPAAVMAGDYVIQVASSKDKQRAEALRDRLAAKGYAAFVEQADLGEKGIWHRVFAGPYSTKDDAEKIITALKSDKFSSAPLLKKR
jgi:DedD protein